MAKLFPAGLEPATFRVLGGRDNHYTTETSSWDRIVFYVYKHYNNLLLAMTRENFGQ